MTANDRATISNDQNGYETNSLFSTGISQWKRHKIINKSTLNNSQDISIWSFKRIKYDRLIIAQLLQMATNFTINWRWNEQKISHRWSYQRERPEIESASKICQICRERTGSALPRDIEQKKNFFY